MTRRMCKRDGLRGEPHGRVWRRHVEVMDLDWYDERRHGNGDGRGRDRWSDAYIAGMNLGCGTLAGMVGEEDDT